MGNSYLSKVTADNGVRFGPGLDDKVHFDTRLDNRLHFGSRLDDGIHLGKCCLHGSVDFSSFISD